MLVQIPTSVPRTTDATLVPGLVVPWIDGLPEPGDVGTPADRLPPPPAAGSSEARADMDAVRGAQSLHTPAADQWASVMDLDGLRTLWYGMLARQLAPEDAARGERFLADLITTKSTVTRELKDHYARPRPFEVDPTLRTPVRRPQDDPSFPSGHTAGAYAAARAISVLAPAATAEAYALARQVAVSRLYGGVHFPSDIRAGATLGVAIADRFLRTAIDPPRAPGVPVTTAA